MTPNGQIEPPDDAEQECPACREWGPLYAERCSNCSRPLDGEVMNDCGPSVGLDLAPARGDTLTIIGIVSLIWLGLNALPTFCVLTVAGGPPPVPMAVMMSFGLIPATVAAVMVFFDLRAMGMGRRDPDGWGWTFAGGVVCGFSVVLHWFVIGWCIFALL